MYMEMLNLDIGHLEERVSGDYHALTITPPNSWHSVWLFWTVEWQVRF